MTILDVWKHMTVTFPTKLTPLFFDNHQLAKYKKSCVLWPTIQAQALVTCGAFSQKLADAVRVGGIQWEVITWHDPY